MQELDLSTIFEVPNSSIGEEEKTFGMWVFPKIMATPKWMVKIMENPIKMDDLGGKPTIFGNIHVQERGVCFFGTNFKLTKMWLSKGILATVAQRTQAQHGLSDAQ